MRIIVSINKAALNVPDLMRMSKQCRSLEARWVSKGYQLWKKPTSPLSVSISAQSLSVPCWWAVSGHLNFQETKTRLCRGANSMWSGLTRRYYFSRTGCDRQCHPLSQLPGSLFYTGVRRRQQRLLGRASCHGWCSEHDISPGTEISMKGRPRGLMLCSFATPCGKRRHSA